MRRCNNCGWGNNPDENTHCEKCNSLLEDAQAYGGDNQFQGAPEVNLGRTVLEMGASQGRPRKTAYKGDTDDSTVMEEGVCPECGYRCKDCLGTDTVVSRDQLARLAFDPRFSPENLKTNFERRDETWDEEGGTEV